MLGFLGGTFPSFTEYKTFWSAASIFHTEIYFFNLLAWGKTETVLFANKSFRKGWTFVKTSMLNSVKLENDDFLWKRSIPLKEKIFTICIEGFVVLHLYLTLFWSKEPLWKSGLSVSLFSLLTSVFASIDFFSVLMVSATLSIKSFPNKYLSCFWRKSAFAFDTHEYFVITMAD